MDIKTLESFSLGDAIFFHDDLNKNLWDMNNQLRPEVKEQLLLIAEDFIEELGIKNLDVKDITVSGSNAAYTYTKHSDLDLHILVDMSKLPEDEVYRELFTAKKNLYNDSHDIKVHGVPVELYVQDTNEPVVSLGEYSLIKDKWLRIPTKRRANFDQTVTKQKYKKLLDLIEKALKVKDIEKVENVISTIKRYRKAGLDRGGEFGPENLAYKALRTQGYIDKLYDLRDKLHSADLSIEEAIFYKDPSQLIDLYLRKVDSKNLSKTTLTKILQGIPYSNLDKALELFSKKYNIKPTDVVWQPSDNTNEDYDPNGPPPGPEFKPTMPAGTVRVDVSDVYDWYKLGQHISNLKGLGHHDFGKGPPSTIMAFGSEPEEHKYIQDLEKTGLTTTDIDPYDPKQPKGMKRQKVDPTYNVNEQTGKKSAIYSTDVYGMTAYHSKCLEPGCDWESKRYDSIKLAQNAAQKHAQKHFKQSVAEEVTESRGSLFSWLKQQFPTWPDYVVKDFLYQGAKFITSQEQLADFLEMIKKDFGQVKWRLEKLPITLDIFTPKTQRMIKSREGGSANPFQVPKDAERHAQQLKMIQQHGVRTEPIIVAKLNNGYDLIEGWHRTIQHLKAFPEGYTGPAWVGYGATYTSEIVEQGVAEAFDQPYKLKWYPGDWDEVTAYADMPDGDDLTIMFNNDENEEGEEAWSVEFYRNDSQEITGEGDAQRIFATVLVAIKTFIKKYKPNRLIFSASKEVEPGQKIQSRANLYDRLVQRYAQTMGYRAFRADAGNKVHYELNKIKKTVEEGASGYIPSNAEKNDPRFKTALTVDIKPDTMKKDAKKFGNKISRAGIPPTLKANGKF